MPERHFQSADIKVRVAWLEGRDQYRIHIEHTSGAALIVPACQREPVDGSTRIEVTGFDGTVFSLSIDENEATLIIEASVPSPILGGGTRAEIPRGPDAPPSTVRVTGDEETMPIQVKD